MDQSAPKFNGSFRMKQLPKAEYRLMRAMIEKYQLDGPHELFACALRAIYETLHSEGGEDWWQHNIIATYRSHPTEVREYELPSEC